MEWLSFGKGVYYSSDLFYDILNTKTERIQEKFEYAKMQSASNI